TSMASASLAWLSWTSRSRSRISCQSSGEDTAIDLARPADHGSASCCPLARGFPAALRTMLDVAPRPEQTRAFGVQQDHEGLRHRLDVEAEVGAPSGR